MQLIIDVLLGILLAVIGCSGFWNFYWLWFFRVRVWRMFSTEGAELILEGIQQKWRGYASQGIGLLEQANATAEIDDAKATLRTIRNETTYVSDERVSPTVMVSTVHTVHRWLDVDLMGEPGSEESLDSQLRIMHWHLFCARWEWLRIMTKLTPLTLRFAFNLTMTRTELESPDPP